MSAQPLLSPQLPADLTTPQGKLVVLLPGLGAVATTLIAGVHLINKKLAQPFGSLTQMQQMPVGQHTNGQCVPIQHLVPLAALADLVFGGWDIFPENAYKAAVEAGVLPTGLLSSVQDELKAVQPWPAVFARDYVPKLTGRHIKRGPTKMHLAEAVMHDIEAFQSRHQLQRSVLIWCGSMEVYLESGSVHGTHETFERGLKENAPEISPSMIYAYAALMSGIPFANGATNLTVDIPALVELAAIRRLPIAAKDLKTGQTMLKTVIAPGLKARMLGLQGWSSTNILGNRDGVVLDDPDAFRTKERSKSQVLDAILQPELYADLYGNYFHKKCGSNFTRPGETPKKDGTTSTSSGGWVNRCRSRSIFSAKTRFWPRRSRSI